MYCDYKNSICLSYNPEFHSRTTHINVRFHFIRDLIEDKIIRIEHISTENMPADILTKGLCKNKHYNNLSMLNLKN